MNDKNFLVFELVVKKHPDAEEPDFSAKYKQAETIKKHLEAWRKDGWRDDATNCLVEKVRYPDSGDGTKDQEVEATEKVIEELVHRFWDRQVPLVAEKITGSLDLLANTALHLGRLDLVGKVYRVKRDYIAGNRVLDGIYNPLRVLGLSNLSTDALVKRLKGKKGTTRLTCQAKLANEMFAPG